jgi:hypothetical protein
MVDAPSVCDGAPACAAGTGRSVCGYLVQTGAMAGTPLRVASPTGQSCATLGSTEGPCALSIFGQPMTSYFAGNTADQIVGELDDCGRYVIRDIDQSAGRRRGRGDRQCDRAIGGGVARFDRRPPGPIRTSRCTWSPARPRPRGARRSIRRIHLR